MTHSGYGVSSPLTTNNPQYYPVAYGDEIAWGLSVPTRYHLTLLPKSLFLSQNPCGVLVYVIGENRYYKMTSNYSDDYKADVCWEEAFPAISTADIDEICV